VPARGLGRFGAALLGWIVVLTPGVCLADSPASRFLEAHNAVRASARPVPEPRLAPLTWSASATSAARRWAQRCRYEHDPQLQTQGLGQNIAAFSSPGRATAAQVVALWAAEAKSYDYAHNTCRAGSVCGHYTQLVWRATSQVGCARQLCSRSSPFPGSTRWELWVCDYRQAGNLVGHRPY
jgi:hypothetical protein